MDSALRGMYFYWAFCIVSTNKHVFRFLVVVCRAINFELLRSRVQVGSNETNGRYTGSEYVGMGYKVGCKDMSHGEKKHDKISKPQVRFLGTVVNVEDLTIRMLRKPCPSGECLL